MVSSHGMDYSALCTPRARALAQAHMIKHIGKRCAILAIAQEQRIGTTSKSTYLHLHGYYSS
eukprot:3914639-Pyramimonas_sp.AAC.3